MKNFDNFPYELPEVPDWMRVDKRKMPSDRDSALKYFNHRFDGLLQEGQEIVVTPEQDYILVTAGTLEMRVYEPTKKLKTVKVRIWEDGVEGVSVLMNTNDGGKAVKAYSILEELAFE
jgi:hypothetical protein